MSRRPGRHPALLVVLIVGSLLCTGCLQNWTQFGGNAAGTRATGDNGITPASVPTLTPSLTGTTGGSIFSTPAVAFGVGFVTSDDGKLDAFDATGVTNCSGVPNTCTPLWTATIEPAGAIGVSGTISSSPAIAGGIVFVGSTNGKLYAFDANGVTNCSGSPKTCTPLWTATTGGAIYSSPTVSGNTLYIGSTDGKLYAFDATGATNCSGSPKVCTPLWTATTGGVVEDTPAVSGSTVYVGSTDGKLYAFDATGVTNCVSTVCSPLWTASTGGPITFSSPAVSGAGSVYVGSTDGKLYVFDAKGVTGCTAGACTPLWTMTTGGSIVSSPAVSNSVAYIGSSDHRLYAVDATGATGCSGAPKTCTALWTATTGSVIRSSAAVAAGMVYIGSDDHHVDAFDATGTTNCSGSPKTCTPLWTTTSGAAVAGSPIIAQGTLYFASLDDSLYADKPWVAPRATCPANPHSGLSPCQLEGAYELPSTVAGSGRTVAIVDAFDDPNAESDLAVYRAQYGLPPCTTANGCFHKFNQNGVAGSYPAGNQGWAEEISLDVDTVSAICPLCHITLVEANSNSDANLLTAEVTAGGLSPTVVSNSWGSGEFSGEHSLDGNFSFPGIPVTFSTGDTGYGATWPASAPNVTAVGGTVLTADSSTRGWSETVWSGANSGCSSQEAKPAWQTDPGCAKRTSADVSALAGSPGEAIYDTYGGDTGWEDFGGTSLASPIIASVYALAYPDVAISSIYANPSSLFDVTSGSNGSCGGSYLCTGAPGYDGPTGLGTPCGTAGFGTGPFTTAACAKLAPTPSAQPALAQPAIAPTLVFTPACGKPTPGFASCDADRISKN
jgi:outer membrane protein assembly factor BamB